VRRGGPRYEALRILIHEATVPPGRQVAVEPELT